MEKHTLDALALAVCKSEADRIIHLVDGYHDKVGSDFGYDTNYTRNLSLIREAAQRIKTEVDRTNETDNPNK